MKGVKPCLAWLTNRRGLRQLRQNHGNLTATAAHRTQLKQQTKAMVMMKKKRGKEDDPMLTEKVSTKRLFPIREPGMNRNAQELQLHEVEAIKKDKEAHARFVKSYEMMLNFYGLRLVNNTTGEVERAAHWERGFRHLHE
nr:hypothetical protein BaRGS_009432 [Batillaria attramentaria]